MSGWDEWYEAQHGDGCGCSGCDGTDRRLQERADTLADLVHAIGPRPSVASVLRAMRLRRAERKAAAL